jgi:hypothetical protein
MGAASITGAAIGAGWAPHLQPNQLKIAWLCAGAANNVAAAVATAVALRSFLNIVALPILEENPQYLLLNRLAAQASTIERRVRAIWLRICFAL